MRFALVVFAEKVEVWIDAPDGAVGNEYTPTTPEARQGVQNVFRLLGDLTGKAQDRYSVGGESDLSLDDLKADLDNRALMVFRGEIKLPGECLPQEMTARE